VITTSTNLQKATEHLTAKDPVLASVIVAHGPCDLKPHKLYYQELVESIVGQQLSIKAAGSIRKRFVELFGGTFPEPAAILAKSIEELRSAGLSGAKANYIRDLAQHVLDGKVVFDKLDNQTNEEIIKELTDVKGIGEWTAHMFLMFCMARLDILPVGDLGIKNGIQKLYGFDHLPTPDEVKAIAEQNKWHPYESVASWYIWRSLDNKPR
jgi:DNA-3-methyladenine glycosylase II